MIPSTQLALRRRLLALESWQAQTRPAAHRTTVYAHLTDDELEELERLAIKRDQGAPWTSGDTERFARIVRQSDARLAGEVHP